MGNTWTQGHGVTDRDGGRLKERRLSENGCARFTYLSRAISCPLSLYLSRCHLWSALSPNVGRIVCVTTSVRSSVMAARDLHIFPSRAMSFPLSLSLSLSFSLSSLVCFVAQRRSDRLCHNVGRIVCGAFRGRCSCDAPPRESALVTHGLSTTSLTVNPRLRQGHVAGPWM